MSNDKKILLGSEDVINKTNQDIYIDVELIRTVDEINKERINNDFNLSEQFDKERNESLKFCIYGTIESKVTNTVGIDVEISSNDKDILYTPKIGKDSKSGLNHTVKTIPLSKNGILSKNIFGYEKSSYYFLFELNRQQLEEQISGITVFPHVKKLTLKIDDEEKNLFDMLEVPIFYIDSSGNIVAYGTETTELNEQGEAIEINNNFPFLYDTHWIKGNFNIIREPFVSFETEEGEKEAGLSISERVGDVEVGVSLDFPSKFGREEVSIGILEDMTVRNPNLDYSYSPKSLSWKIGEQIKNFKIKINDDFYVENDETIIFKLENTINTVIKNPSAFTFTIINDDIPSTINFSTTAQTVKEGNKTLTIDVKLDRKLKVPNQYVYVVLNNSATTATIVTDFESTGNNTFIKKIELLEGECTKSFTIDLFEDNQYELDKQIVLELQNPTQNLIIGNQNKHTITIEDNLVPKYVRYNIPHGNGSGVFRQKGSSAGSGQKIEWKLDGGNSTVITNFSYGIYIINKGTQIVYDGKEVGYNEKLTDFEKNTTQTNKEIADLFNAVTAFNYISLPSNFEFNNTTKQFDKCKYEFQFVLIERIKLDSNEDKHTFNNAIVPAFELMAGNTETEKTYHLVSQISNIKTRYNINGDCESRITGDEITIQMNGTLFMAKNITSGTNINWRKFLSSPVLYTCGFDSPRLPLKKV